MKIFVVALCFCLPAAQLLAQTASRSGVAYSMKYEGGSLGLKQHDGVKVSVESDQVVCSQGKQRHAISVKAINEVSYGNDVHRRVGAAVGVGVVTLGVGALLALAKTKKHYVGVVWADQTGPTGSPSKGGVVFKVGKGEYRGFLKALEGVTGLKTVNADAVGSGGTSKP